MKGYVVYLSRINTRRFALIESLNDLPPEDACLLPETQKGASITKGNKWDVQDGENQFNFPQYLC